MTTPIYKKASPVYMKNADVNTVSVRDGYKTTPVSYVESPKMPGNYAADGYYPKSKVQKIPSKDDLAKRIKEELNVQYQRRLAA